MTPSTAHERLRERLLLVTLAALLLFASPLLRWWTTWQESWLLPYLLWLATILPVAALNWRYGGERGEGP